jgi:hypothetical protein
VASFDDLARAEAAQGVNLLYAPRTVKARENAKRQVVEFHQRLYGPDPRFAELPVFHDTISPSGQFVSAARNARLFFTERERLAQSTLANLKCQLSAVYAEYAQGLPPWSAADTRAEAVTTRRAVNRIAKIARKPEKKPSMGSVLLSSLLSFLGRDSKNQVDMLASRAAQACIAFMRGTASRPEDAIMLERSFISENRPLGGPRNGLNIFYPEVGSGGNVITFKGKDSWHDRFKVMPEKLEDGTPVSDILWDFLEIAPRRLSLSDHKQASRLFRHDLVRKGQLTT